MNNKKFVYAIKNEVTNRIYVGSSQSPRYRLNKHMSALKHHQHKNELMQLDYDRYGDDSFVTMIVGEYKEKIEKHQEIFTMKILRTQDERYGYNYKDKSGTCKGAIASKWRVPSMEWKNYKEEKSEHTKNTREDDFLARLDRLKDENGLNNLSLSQETGIPYTTIVSLYEKGYGNIKWKTLSKLCKYFMVTAEYLMDGE